MNFRIGQGYDVHALAHGESLWLCGIELSHTKGTVAHSDGDVAIHAICDAILGAAALRDIGYHFPDTDPNYKNADSKILLRKCIDLLNEKNYAVGNIDVTICAEQPKINPHIEQMIECLAECMNINGHQISIKATTSEKLGFVGRQEGISTHAIALIYQIPEA